MKQRARVSKTDKIKMERVVIDKISGAETVYLQFNYGINFECKHKTTDLETSIFK